MKAMILAAGRGKRMEHLTEKTPKPLLKVNGTTLIEHQIKRLQESGFCEIVINVGYLGNQISDYLGNGSRYGLDIAYSKEPQEGLETGGGVLKALPLLGNEPFLLTNADLICDYPYKNLKSQRVNNVHLVLVDTPSFKSSGDFSLIDNKLQLGSDLTFSGISVIAPIIFDTFMNDITSDFFPIAPLFNAAVAANQATAEYYQGLWHNVGNPQQLADVSVLTNI